MFKGKGERRFAGEFPTVGTAQDMSEEELTREIDAAVDRLTVLYAARRGKKLQVPGNADVWQWCSGCGKAQLEGRQLCNACAALL